MILLTCNIFDNVIVLSDPTVSQQPPILLYIFQLPVRFSRFWWQINQGWPSIGSNVRVGHITILRLFLCL
jgi:hypothetical protein